MNIITYSIPLFILAMAIEYLHARARRRPLYRLNDTLSNLGAGIFQQTLGFAPLLLTLAAYPYIHERWALPLFKGRDSLGTYLACLILVDFLYYWAHRMYHRTGLGWTGHIVHHQSEEYNLSVALRQSWLQGLHGLPFALAPAFLGFEMEVALSCSALNTVYQFWIHTQLIDRCPRWFEAVFNTPSHHRVHHGRNPRYIDKNYAGSLIIWDRLFGTFEAEKEAAVYGVTQPTETWNPLTAQFGPWLSLLRKGRGKGLWLNIKYHILPPGWNELDGDQPPPFIPRDKYDPRVSARRGRAALGSFILALGLLLAFLLGQGSLPVVVKAGFVFAIVSLLCLTGFLLEGDRPSAQNSAR